MSIKHDKYIASSVLSVTLFNRNVTAGFVMCGVQSGVLMLTFHNLLRSFASAVRELTIYGFRWYRLILFHIGNIEENSLVFLS